MCPSKLDLVLILNVYLPPSTVMQSMKLVEIPLPCIVDAEILKVYNVNCFRSATV